MSDVTLLLAAVKSGEPSATDRLLDIVYTELNRMAAGQMACERPGQSLSPTVLVHEAYLRLVKPGEQLPFESRRHFFGAAAQAMRRIRVDAAHARCREKRGGNAIRVDLPDVAGTDNENDKQLLALDEALSKLTQVDPAATEVVNLHHFAGLSHEQVAETLGTTVYQARQKWDYARAVLRDALKKYPEASARTAA